MSSKQYFSLSAAARHLGIDRTTLKRWLLAEGLALPKLERGARMMIPIEDLERISARRQPRIDWRLLRMKKTGS